MQSSQLTSILSVAVSSSSPPFPGCSGVFLKSSEDECDVLVPGEQLGDSPSSPQRDDLCGPGGL